MKFSIVVPVYNEEEAIKSCLIALVRLDYPKKDYEVVVVNDGSTDKTKENIQEIITKNRNVKITLINQKNKGRAIAREVGARRAKSNNLLFTDARCEVEQNALNVIAKKKYPLLVGSPLSKEKGALNRFNRLVRKPLYGNQFNTRKFTDFFIDQKNFDDAPKGTTVLFIKKDLFLNSQIDNKNSKDSSDDTKLLWNVIQTMPLLKTADLKASYNARESMSVHLKHTLNRGPKFVDYYLSPGRKYFVPLILFYLLVAAAIVSIVLYPLMFLLGLVVFLILTTIVSVILAENLKDFLIMAYVLPLTAIMFALGLLKGGILRIK